MTLTAVGSASSAPGVQVMMPLSPETLLLVSDRPADGRLRVIEQRHRHGLDEPWWAIANRVAWLSAKRYVVSRTVGHLEASMALVHPEDRRRDLHLLTEEEALADLHRRGIGHERNGD